MFTKLANEIDFDEIELLNQLFWVFSGCLMSLTMSGSGGIGGASMWRIG